ncbi:MAG: DUF4837 family protein [Bacteroidales bacterium]|nr:DUF4837 family protein [Bacteroidales bacterium]
MKRYVLLFLTAITFFVSCKSPKQKISNGLPSSSGKTLEMIIVTPDSLYKGELLDSIHQIFEKSCSGLPQAEPWFDVVHLTPSSFINSEMFTKHKNILIIDKNAGNPNTIKQAIDYKAYPQTIYEIKTDDMDSIYSILSRYAKTIRHQFRNNEHRRMGNAYKRDENLKLSEKIQKTFNLKLTFSADFYLAKETKNFFWIRKETKKESFNVMIYKKPYTSDDLLLEKKIIELRDSLGKAFIPASMPNSYMGTELRENVAELHRDTIKAGDFAMIETRGIWRSFGDFMGGPFVNYVFKNPETKELVMIDCFLYNPNQPKRDLLMQLESIVHNIEQLNKTNKK